MQLRTAILTLAPIILLSPILSDLAHFAKSTYTNAPSRLPRINALGDYEIKFADRIRNCEHSLLIEDKGVAILGCDPGRDGMNTVMGVFLDGQHPSGGLWAYDYASGASDDDALTEVGIVGLKDDLHPLGMAYHAPSSTLFATNHLKEKDGSRIEVFKLDFTGGKIVALHKRTIKHPLLHAPNSMTVINEHELYVTNDHHFPAREHPVLSVVETYSVLPGGSVVHVDISKEVTCRVLSRIPFANGVVFTNPTTLVVASTNKASLFVYSVNQTTRDLSLRNKLRFPFMVDNLSVDTNGKLLVAGHPHAPSMVAYMESRPLCNSEAGKDQEICKTTVAATWVSEWTEKEGRRDLYAGTEYPTGCTAVRDVSRKIGIVSGLYAKGLLVWRE